MTKSIGLGCYTLSMQKQPKMWESGMALKSMGEESWEFKGGGQEMAAMM